MNLYNTLGKEIQPFIPYDGMNVKMYTCGPTVYNYAHIGNLRTYIFEDILEKTLTYLGYHVTRCMNITDVGHLTDDADDGEDKMAKEAKKENKSVADIAQFYTDAFFQDTAKLNIKTPEIVEPASRHIDDYIKVVEKLLLDGYAYQSNGNVYFDVSKLEDYYELSGKNPEELIVGAREDVSADEHKKNPADFGLWFTNSKFQDQALKWDSPWGVGYPGWHIECSTLAIRYLGEHLDIHCGGVDNIFPHHSNEIAQSEAYLGHKWCSYWVHGEHLNDKSGKMSKSKGEFLTVSLLEKKGYDPIVYRFFCLQSHYRKQLVFSYESLDMARTAYLKLKNRIASLADNPGELDCQRVAYYDQKFKDALADDLNTANALTVLYDVLKSDETARTKLELVSRMDQVLSLNLVPEKKTITAELETYIQTQLERRTQAKKAKNYMLADEIRETLKQQGILIRDTREGTSYELVER